MRILYLYQYFTTPKGSYSTRVYEFTKEWVERGHQVQVVTARYYKSDITANKFIDHQNIDGIDVYVINICINNKHRIPKRILNFLLYSFVSIYLVLKLKYDIIIASSGPITIGIPALLGKWIKKKPLVFEVRDLWPEAPIELGVIKNKLIIKISYWFEKLLYKNAALVIPLSPGMEKNILNRFPGTKTLTIPNQANLTLFASKKNFFDDYLQPRKYVIYTGNIGQVNNSELLYKAAKALKNLGRNDIKILLIGEGQDKEKLKTLARNLPNLIVKDPMPKKDLVPYVQNALASVVPLMDLLVLNTSSPNKLFESLAAGVPVIQTTTGWIKEMVESNNLGFTVSAQDETELVQKILLLDQNPDLWKTMGNSARKYVKNHFDKSYLAKKYLDGLLEIIQNTQRK